MRTKVATEALGKFYRTLLKARSAGWRASLTKTGLIRLHAPGEQRIYCPITCVYRVEFGGSGRVGDAGGSMSSELGLARPLFLTYDMKIATAVIDAADEPAHKLHKNYSWAADLGRHAVGIRKTLFRILGLPKSKL